jgi:ribosomal protein S12 methylthiotransferase accessory factor
MLRLKGELLDAPIRLRDGTQRGAGLATTWRRFAPAAQRAGITRIADLTGLDTLGIPVFAAIRPLGKSLSTQQGKGLTAEAARVSALMESLETWTAEELALPRVRGSYRALARKRSVVDVNKLPRPKRKLDLDARIEWVEGWDLVADAPILVPAQAVTLDTTRVAVVRSPAHPAPARPAIALARAKASAPMFDISSNGLASGNSLVEAILHGACEVIERDAEAAWRRAGGDRRLVLDTIPDPACRALIERITASGARVFVWDLASDVGLCAIGCAIVEDPRAPTWRPLGCYQGFGAHLEAHIAIARALTEAAQTRLTYIAGGRDDFFPWDYARATDPDALRELWQRVATPCDEPVAYDELPRHDSASLGAALATVVALVRTQVIAVDLTHPKLGVPVVKVIVPGRATDVEALG